MSCVPNHFVLGEPTACPECCVNDARIAQEEIDDEGLNIELPHPLQLLPSSCTALLLQQSVTEFISIQRELLTAHSNWLEQQLPWRRPIFKPSFVACFVVLNQNTASATSFNPQRFGKVGPAGYGIEVYQWDRSSLQAAVATVKKEHLVVLLLGYGFVCRTFVQNNNNLPNKKKEKDKWVFDKKRSGYDSVQLSNGNIVFWDPFCLYATHRLVLTSAQLKDILQSMDTKSQLSLAPELISFTKPDTPNISATETRKTSTATVEDFQRAVQILEGTPGEGCRNISTRWDGHSFGAVDQFAADEQKELETKLSFCHHVFHPEKPFTLNPFSGINCLRQHIQASLHQQELKLLLCLELCHTNNISEADEALREYVDAVQAGDYDAHPLLLLAIARSLGPSHAKYTECLDAFTSLYAASSWLTKGEVSFLAGATGSSSTSASTSVASARSLWEELKTKEGCISNSMDELLELTGLTQVKRSAIEMFKTAMKIAKMTPDQRKHALGTFCLNYVFLGNPGTGKTTVARLYAKILKDSKIRPKGTFVECTAQ